MTAIIVGKDVVYDSIQDAIDAAEAGDTIQIAAGTYAENLTISTDDLTIVAEGEVILAGSFKSDNDIDGTVAEFTQTTPPEGADNSSGSAITVQGSGVTIDGLTISSFSSGVNIGNGVSGLTLNDMVITDVVTGIRKGSGAAVSDLTINGGEIRDSFIGMYFAKETATGLDITGVEIDGMAFSNLTYKGIYAETLSDALITGITMNNVGQFGNTGTGAFGAGIDINLKWDAESTTDAASDDHAPYSGITIENFTFTDVGLSNGGGEPHSGGAAIAVKTRDDGPSYDSPETATFEGAVVIQNGSIDGTSTGIRAGEPGKATGGPAVTVTDVTITNAVHDAAHGDVDNVSQSPFTVNLADGGDSLIAHAGATGDFIINGGNGDDTIASGSGDDIIDGGAGNDAIDGGAGIDTAVLAGNRADFTVSLGASSTTITDDDTGDGNEGTDTLTGVEIVQFADSDDEGSILIVGAGGFATIQAAIDAASEGDTIIIAAGVYNENVTVNKDGLILVGDGAVEINGTFSEDNPGYGSSELSLAEWLKTAEAYTGGAAAAVTIAASGVSLSNITIKDSSWGIELADGANGTTLEDVILESNMYGIYKQFSSAITGLSITGGSISDGYIGINFDKSAGGGDATGVTIDGTAFADLLRKGIYAETLSDAHFTNFTMENVGQWGSIGPNNNHISGAGGNGINLNLKYGDYSGIQIDNFTLTDVGSSDLDGTNPTGHVNGGAIVIEARDDGADYGANPATLANVTIHDGTISGSTSTGIHVGEPGKDNAGPEVTVTNVTIDGAEHTADHGDIANESESTMTVVGTSGNDSLIASTDSDGAFDIDGAGGDDAIAGGSANDILEGGAGDDALDGSAGTDTAVYAASLTAADITAVPDADPVTDGLQAGWQISAGAEGTDTLTGVEIIDHAGEGNILLVGSGGFATIQEAIDAADEGDTIVIAAGVYDENVTVNKDGLALVGLGDVVINGTFTEDNSDYATSGQSLAAWLKETGGYSSTSVGVTVAADGVTLSNIKISDNYLGIEFIGSTSGTTLDGVVVESNVIGLHKGATAAITDLTVNGGEISDGFIGIDFMMQAVGGGNASGVLIDGTNFAHLLRKGIYAETLSDAHLTNITMEDVGQFGGTTFNGSLGAGGNGINLNLKYGDYSDIEIDNFTLNNVGASDRDGLDEVGQANGGAIVIEARDDGADYGANPATLTNVAIHDGTISGSTSTGIHVGEPGKDNAGPDVTVTNVTIDGAEHTADHGDIANESESTMTVVGTSGNDSLIASTDSDGAFDIDGAGGDDTIAGGSANDVLEGGAGDDALDGSAGTDTAVYAASLTAADITAVPDTDPVTDGLQAGWQISAGAEGTDTLTGVEIIDHAGEGNILLVGSGGFATIQAAIDAADEGDTIVIAAGTYAENVTIDKGVTLLGLGEVTIDPVSGVAITLGGDIGGADVTIDNLNLVGGSKGISVLQSANAGKLTVVNSHISGNDEHGIYVLGDDPDNDGDAPIVAGITAIDVIDSTFADNGFGGDNGAGHIKLFGFQGDALFQNLTITGADTDTPQGQRPDYGIEITGYVNNGGANPVANGAPDIGTVVFDGVVIDGAFHKNAVAVSNFNDLDGLSIGGENGGLDIGGAVTNWGPVFNIDSSEDSVIDASGYDITFPDGPGIVAEIQGDSNNQDTPDQTITGTSSDDAVMGKGGNDTLYGGDGNDTLYGHDKPDGSREDDTGNDALHGDAGDDTLNGGAGDDSLDGGTGDDALNGGDGIDTAVLAGNRADFTISLGATSTTVTDGSAGEGNEGTDTLTGVEIVQFADSATAGKVLLVGAGGFATIQEAIDAASEGDTIIIAAGTYNENITIDKGLTFLGANAGEAGTGDRGAETLITWASGIAVSITTTSAITFDGLKFEGGTVLRGNEADANVTITNSVFALTTGGNGSNNFFLSRPETFTFTNNLLDATGYTGAMFQPVGDPTDPSHSTVTFTGNTFNGHPGTYVGGEDNDVPVVINLSNVNGIVSDNEFNGVDIGVLVADGTGPLEISGNTFDGLHREEGTSGEGSAAGVVFYELDESFGPVTITDNTFSDSDAGIRTSGTPGASVEGGTITIDGNTFTDVDDPALQPAAGALNLADSTIDDVEVPLYVVGGNTADDITGTAGDDQLYGNDGGDTLTGGLGDDLVEGGAGDDTINYAVGDGADTVDGGEGDDTLAVTGTSGDDVIDVVLTGDVITTIAGIDPANVENVTVDGGDGIDTLSFAGMAEMVLVDLQSGPVSGFDSVTGIENVTGGSGNDLLTGNDGTNVLTGGDGNDALTGGLGDDELYGGAGDDTIHYVIGQGIDIIAGGDDTDTLSVVGTAGNDVIDVVLTGGVITTIEGMTPSGIENVTLDGLLGNDTLSYAGTTEAVTVDLGAETADGFETLYGGIENVTGGSGNDSLTGDGSDNRLTGGAGDDALTGGGGNDTAVYAGTLTLEDVVAIADYAGGDEPGWTVEDGLGGTDTLAGIKYVEHAGGRFLLVGNGAFSTLADALAKATKAGDVIVFTQPPAAGETITATVPDPGEDLNFSLPYDANFEITVQGNNNNTITTGGGDDVITTGNGSDVIETGAGNDFVDAGEGNDVIHGGDGLGDDVYVGGVGNNTVVYPSTSDGVLIDLRLADRATQETVGGTTIGALLAANTLDPNLFVGYAEGEEIGTDVLIDIQNATGGAGDDIIHGNDNANVLDGGADHDGGPTANADALYGYGGADTLTGGTGADEVDGGDGDDIVIYTAGDGTDTLLDGGDEDETLGDTLTVGGTDDDDTIKVVVDGGSVVKLTSNDDTHGDDDNVSGFETVTLDLGEGDGDTLSYAGTEEAVTVDLEAATADGFDSIAGVENVTGGSGNDTLTGDDNANVLDGDAGDDTLNGGLGNDTLDGGAGNDTADYGDRTAAVVVTLNGATDATVTIGGTAEDTVRNIENVTGGSGNDTLTGDGNANVLIGGEGDDTLTGGAGADDVNGGEGDDTVAYTAGDGTDTLLDGGDDVDGDTLEIGGTDDDDTIKVLVSSGSVVKLSSNTDTHGSDENVSGFEMVTLDLGAGDSDTLSYAGTEEAVTVDLGVGSADGFDSIAGVENVTGGSGNDTLTGNGSANELDGGAGDDTLTGGAGADVLDGGIGTDTADFSDKAVAVVVTLNGATDATVTVGGAAEDTVRNIENVTGGSGNDTLTGDGNANLLEGGSGDDTLTGGAGADVLDGGIGTDTASYGDKAVAVVVTLNGATDATVTVGGTAEDTIRNIENVTGGSGNDTLTGDGNANVLAGGAGDDTLTGGLGNDTLDGGIGTDTADYTIVLDGTAVTFNGTTWQVAGGAEGADTLIGIEKVSHGGSGNILLVGGGGYANRTAAEAVMVTGDVLVFASTPGTLTDTDGTIDTVVEQAANGTMVGIDVSAATDIVGGVVTYALVNNAGGAFAINAVTGVVTVADGTLLDFDTASSQQITVRATNALGAYSDQDFTVAVTEMDSPLPPPPPPPPPPPVDLTGTNGKDTLTGGAGDDTLDGGKGNDKLYGDAGDDLLTGGNGKDKLYGDAGDDTLEGGKGKDKLYGGDGIDTASYASSSGKVNVNLGKSKQKGGDADGDKLFDIENVMGSKKGDKIVGDNGANALDGAGGNDALHGKGGNDLLTGGKGKDTFYFKSGWDADTILDFESRDTIDISVKGVETFKALKDLMTETDGNVVIDFGKGDVLTIVDTTIDALHRSDFHL